MWNWHLLTCQAVSKTPKPEDLDVWITCPGNAPAMDRSCQTPREYWMHLNAAPSLAALERCYTLLLVLANPSMKMSATLPMY
jgi:hypothetical protein